MCCGSTPSRYDRLVAVWVLMAALVVVHIATASVAPSFIDALIYDRPAVLRIAVGGQHRGLVANRQQWWRLCTSVLLHANLLHLLTNMLAVWVLARLVEPFVGPTRWLGGFVAGGVAGSVASQMMGVPMSDGASGGAFALLGAAVVIGYRMRDTMDETDQQTYGPILIGFVLLNVVGSFLVPFIDAIGHVGGLVAGLVWGALTPIDCELGAAEKVLWAAVLGGFVLACAYGWVPR